MIEKLVVLNPADKTRMYSVVTGAGAPLDVKDPLIADVKQFPVGSQFTDTEGKNFYVRVADKKEVADWKKVNA